MKSVVCVGHRKKSRCSKCKMTTYCSKQCQTSHHSYHADYYSMIVDLRKIETEKLYGKFSIRQKQKDKRTKLKLLNLIGEKHMLNC